MNSSSQSFAPMSRLLWKEYRAQRALWLAMFAFGLAPQLLFCLVMADASNRVGAVWAVVATVPLLFVIGSLAILFAGEREERTSDWLQHLSVPPLWLMLAKWGFVVISALALMVALSVVAVLLVWALPPPPAMALWFFAAFILWGSLGSLISRRVITAVPAMGFWWLMTMIVPVVWLPQLFGVLSTDPGHPRYQEVLTVLSFLAVGIADVWLGWRWCHGKYLDAQVFDDFNTRLSGWLGLRTRTESKSRIPTRIESANPWRREWQRLIWQERHRETYHRSLLYLGGVIGILLALFGALHRSEMMSGVVPLLLAFPLTMGVLGFRYDGEGQPLRFLANRGVSPHVLWMAKHVVWLPRAIWIPFAVWLIAWGAEWLAASVNAAAHFRPLGAASMLAWIQRDSVLWFIVLSYGCGHLAAMVFRRVILAIVGGVAMNLVVAQWMSLMVVLQVPLWWSLGGVAVWLFGLSWWYARYWMMETRVHAHPVQWASFVLIPPVLLVGSVAGWRVGEVGATRQDPDVAAEIVRQLQPLSRQEQATQDRLASTLGGFNRVYELLKQHGRVADGPAPDRGVPEAIKKFWSTNESRLEELLKITQEERRVSSTQWVTPYRVDANWMTPVLFPQQQVLLEAARLRLEEGHLDEALKYYLATLRLSAFYATDGTIYGRQMAVQQQSHTLQGILWWANHPHQSAASLKSALRSVQTELSAFPGLRETLVAEYLERQQLLTDDIEHGQKDSANRSNTDFVELVVEGSRLLPWERYRAQKLLEQDLLEQDQSAAFLATWLNNPGTDTFQRLQNFTPLGTVLGAEVPERRGYSPYPDSSIARTDLDRLWASTPMLPKPWRRINQAFWSAVIEHEVISREVLLALALLAWKHEHNEWPDSLDKLKILEGRGLTSATILDPWKGEQFEYGGSLLNRLPDTRGKAILLTSKRPHQLVPTHTFSGNAGLEEQTKLEVVDGKLHLRIANSVRPPR